MPSYQIHRLKDSYREHFRLTPHTSGVSIAKPKDYEKGSTVEAASPYAVWVALQGTEQALGVGDLLETERGELRIYKYIGFEEARWFVPEPEPAKAPHEAAESAPTPSEVT